MNSKLSLLMIGISALAWIFGKPSPLTVIVLLMLLFPALKVTVPMTFPAQASFPGVNESIVFYSNRDGGWKIYVMNSDGADTKQLTFGTKMDGEPTWSPNGSSIAFTGWAGKYPQIFVMNSDGSNRTQLTFDPNWHGEPCWSPDGRKIIYTGWNGSTEIYVMNAGGSNQTRLTFTLVDETHPVWSPDGGRIAFVSNRDGDNEIYIMNPDGKGIQKLTDNQEEDYYPAWSPDGKKIAFVSNRVTPTNREGDAEIFVMNLDGSDATQLTFNSIDDGDPAWSPDKRKLAFTRLDTSRWPFVGWEICIMNSDGTDQTQLTDTWAIIGSHGGYNWGPNWRPNRNLTFHIAFETIPAGKGSIFFDNKSYSDGEVIPKAPGTYRIMAEPTSGYRFTGWEADGSVTVAQPDSEISVCVILSDGILRMVQSNASASSAPAPLWPWVRIDHITYPDGSGAIRSEPEPTYGILINPWATFYQHNATVEFTATPYNQSEWEFVEWELPNGVKTLDNPLRITVKHDGYVKAIFHKRTIVEAPAQSD